MSRSPELRRTERACSNWKSSPRRFVSELRDAIVALSRPVDLPARTLLLEQGETPAHAYFLCTGVVSMVVTMAEGGSAEVGLTGHEGVVGAMQLLGRTPTPSQSYILMPGSAIRVRLDDTARSFSYFGRAALPRSWSLCSSRM